MTIQEYIDKIIANYKMQLELSKFFEEEHEIRINLILDLGIHIFNGIEQISKALKVPLNKRTEGIYDKENWVQYYLNYKGIEIYQCVEKGEDNLRGYGDD